MIAIIAPVGLRFGRVFFFLRQFSKKDLKLHPLCNSSAVLVYIALVSISEFIFIYPLFKTKDPKGFFITAGIAVISFGFLLTLHSRMTETPFTVFYLKVAAIMEFLIFALGLAYRERQQEVAKQQADFALRESRLLQGKNQLEAEWLQGLNDFKSRFFTNITHEFRTPLTVILGMAEQLKKEGGRLKAPKRPGRLYYNDIWRISAKQ